MQSVMKLKGSSFRGKRKGTKGRLPIKDAGVQICKEIIVYSGSIYESGHYGTLFKGEEGNVPADGRYDTDLEWWIPTDVDTDLKWWTTTDVDTFWYNRYDNGFKYHMNDAYKDVWDGWDAALIVSKRVKTPQTVANYYVAAVAGKDDIIKGMTLEEYEMCLGKRKAREMWKTEERDVTARNGFQLLQPSWDKEEDKYLKKAKPETNNDPDSKKEVNEAFPNASCSAEVETLEHTIVKGIAALCLRVMDRSGMAVFERMFTESDFEIIREDVLRSAAKFIMSVFDKEDFLRIGYGRVVADEYSMFYSCLQDCKCDPLVAVAEGLVKVDEFPSLREHDLCDVIRQYQRKQPYHEYRKVCPWLFSCYVDELDESDLRIVGEERQKFVRLKADRKMQLDLEMLHMKGFHVLDNLVLEALTDINVLEIEKLTADDCCVSPSVARCIFRNGIYEEFYSLSTMKSFALKHFLGAVTYPLSSLGPCTSELLEVIKIADHERRMEGQRLISIQHLLYGLSLSRVSDCVKEILNDRGMKPSTLATFGIYKLSRDAADCIGDAHVGLEHLVLAIFFGKQENARMEPSSLFFGDTWDAELLECLRNSNTKCGLNSLEESNVYKEFLPKECYDGSKVTCDILRLMTNLKVAQENGLKLLAIREEN